MNLFVVKENMLSVLLASVEARELQSCWKEFENTEARGTGNNLRYFVSSNYIYVYMSEREVFSIFCMTLCTIFLKK